VLDWDAANVAHVARHGLTPDMVEAALSDPYALERSAGMVGDEERFALIGAADSRRILTVIYTWRSDRIRVVTAYHASSLERRLYRGRR